MRFASHPQHQRGSTWATAVDTRVKDASLRPSRLVHTLSITLVAGAGAARVRSGGQGSCEGTTGQRRGGTYRATYSLVRNLLGHVAFHQLALELRQCRLDVGAGQSL